MTYALIYNAYYPLHMFYFLHVLYYTLVFKKNHFLDWFKYYCNILLCPLFCIMFKDWFVLLHVVSISLELLSNSIRYLIYLTQSTMGYSVLKSLLAPYLFSIRMPLLMIRLNVCCTRASKILRRMSYLESIFN
jgi:hypothetical protein